MNSWNPITEYLDEYVKYSPRHMPPVSGSYYPLRNSDPAPIIDPINATKAINGPIISEHRDKYKEYDLSAMAPFHSLYFPFQLPLPQEEEKIEGIFDKTLSVPTSENRNLFVPYSPRHMAPFQENYFPAKPISDMTSVFQSVDARSAIHDPKFEEKPESEHQNQFVQYSPRFMAPFIEGHKPRSQYSNLQSMHGSDANMADLLVDSAEEDEPIQSISQALFLPHGSRNMAPFLPHYHPIKRPSFAQSWDDAEFMNAAKHLNECKTSEHLAHFVAYSPRYMAPNQPNYCPIRKKSEEPRFSVADSLIDDMVDRTIVSEHRASFQAIDPLHMAPLQPNYHPAKRLSHLRAMFTDKHSTVAGTLHTCVDSADTSMGTSEYQSQFVKYGTAHMAPFQPNYYPTRYSTQLNEIDPSKDRTSCASNYEPQPELTTEHRSNFLHHSHSFSAPFLGNYYPKRSRVVNAMSKKPFSRLVKAKSAWVPPGIAPFSHDFDAKSKRQEINEKYTALSKAIAQTLPEEKKEFLTKNRLDEKNQASTTISQPDLEELNAEKVENSEREQEKLQNTDAVLTQSDENPNPKPRAESCRKTEKNVKQALRAEEKPESKCSNEVTIH